MTTIDLTIKEARNDFPIHPFLKQRWSPRAFDGRIVEKEKLQSIFEAARWSPSSSNDQPWAFLVGFKGDDVYNAIYESMEEFNRIWTPCTGMLGITCARKTRLNKPDLNFYRVYDLGQSMAHLTFQAMSLGVYVHQMGGFDKGKARELLSIPDDYDILTIFTMGYLGDLENLHPRMQRTEVAPRERRSSKNFVFTGTFGHTASFLE